LKLVCIALITVALSVDCIGLDLRLRSNDQRLTDTELREAQQLAMEFTKGFLRTTDLAPLVKDLFQKDFIEHYKRGKSKGPSSNPSPHVYFVPGLEYNSRLLAKAGSEDWLRFYTAANNFLFFGFMSAIKNPNNASNISAADMYPSDVIKLLKTDPILSNMIVREGRSKAVGSVAEMQKATAILEQAVSLMRQKTKGQAPLNIDEKELTKAMLEDEYFRPIIETVDEEFFGLPQGTQVIFINTPILFRLMLVKANNNKLEILWAEPSTGN
jgi:hypothetical protein